MAIPARAALLQVLVGALTLTACVHAPPTPDSLEVDQLDFEGTKQLDQAEVKKKILTGASSWLPWWFPVFGKTEWFDSSAWQADLRRITRFYEANGYYQARILDQEITPTREGHVKLLVRLKEGAPATVSTFEVTGLEALPDDQRATVLDHLPLAAQQVFVEEQWVETRRLIGSRLRELGYATALVSGQAMVDADAARVEVKVEVVTGVRYRFGRIVAASDVQVPARIITDVAAIDLHTGDWFSESAMLEAQGRIFQMGVFSGVKVTRGAVDPESGTVPVVVDVREAPFSSLRAGFGLGGDLFRQEIRAIGEYTNRNLGLSRLFSRNARLDRLTVKVRAGWAFLPTLWDVASGDPAAKTGPTGRLLLEYEFPRLFDLRTLSLQTSAEFSRMLDSAFDYYGGEFKLGVIWRPRTDLTVFPSLNFDGYLLNNQVSLRDQGVPAATLGCPRGAPCLLSFLDLSVEFDRRDNRLEPKQGFYVALSLQGGVSSTGTLKPYLRIVPEARGYVSFGPERRFTLAGKLRVGTLISTDEDTPIVARFFSGGSNMRGFNSRRLSPQYLVPLIVQRPDPTCDATPAPIYCPRTTPQADPSLGEALSIGGNSLIEASLEVRWNVWGDLVLALFNDWGLVSLAPLGPRTDFANHLYAAVGVGARYRTPLGPLRLDFGVRLPFIGHEQEVNTDGRLLTSSPGCFFGSFAPPPVAQATPQSYAGSPDNLCTLHLSIGEAF